MIEVATDGACKGNPGPGGWGFAVFKDGEYVHGKWGGEAETTNNRMELIAFIEACKYLRNQDVTATLWIDSMYVLKGATEWLRGWRAKDYKGVKNEDLWREIAELRRTWLECELKWVKGHSGNPYNEKADELANLGCQETIIENDDW